MGRDNPTPVDVSVDLSSIGEDMHRKIRYTFSEDVLRLPNIQTTQVLALHISHVIEDGGLQIGLQIFV